MIPQQRETIDELKRNFIATAAVLGMVTIGAKIVMPLQSVLATERHERWLECYKKVKAKRDKLAAKLRETYPVLIAQLSDLLECIDDDKNH
jgi:hypothetical protein